MFDFWEYAVGIGVVALIVVLCWAGYKDQQAWDAFKIEHHCIVTARKAPHTVTAVTTNGDVAIGTTMPRVTYHCDDGVDYTREELQ